MARTVFASTGGDVLTVVRDDPTTAFPAGKDLSPATSAVTVWMPDRTTQVTDLMAVNPVTLVVTATAITSVTPASTGRVAFAGPDGYNGMLYVKDASGAFWMVLPNDILSRISSLGGQLQTAANAAAVRALLDLENADINALISSYLTTNGYLTGANPTATRTALGVDYDTTAVQTATRLRADGYVRVLTIDPTDPLPTSGVEVGDIVMRRQSATAGYAQTDLAHPAPSVGAGTTAVATPAASGGTDVVFAHVWSTCAAATVTGGTAAAVATAVTGGGRTWTKVAGSDLVTSNSQLASNVWRGVPTSGSGTTADVTATFASGFDGRGIRLVQISGGPGALVQIKTFNGSAQNPTVTFDSGAGASHPVIAFFAGNSSAQTIAAASGSPFTDIGNQVSGTTNGAGYRTAGFWSATSQNTLSLAGSSTAIKLVQMLELA